MNLWEQFLSTASVESVLSFTGLSVLAFLFARDLILTKGQHLRRVEDLVKAYETGRQDLLDFHARELAEKDARLVEAREARDQWQVAEGIARARADAMTNGFREMAEALKDVRHVLESLDRALPAAKGGGES